MWANASSSSSSSSSSPAALFFLSASLHCLVTRPSSLVFQAFIVTNIVLLLPLCGCVLGGGLRDRRRTASLSHADVFTHHMASMELLRVAGCAACCFALTAKDLLTLCVGNVLLFFTWYGESFFHILTCVERHLAAARPVAYLRLREERWIRRRNAAVVGVWLLCGVEVVLSFQEDVVIVSNFGMLALSLLVVLFCSLSVLRVLIRPGPGEPVGGARGRVGGSKRRAFYTILAILGALLLRFSWCLYLAVLTFVERRSDCVVLTYGLWLSLPSSLVLPLLYLLRQARRGRRKGQ